ncbi:peptidyl-prolyl cis-trans isomerase [Erythrobacter mangrovi]|uniref:Parvulin-like PPIase n=1 Tax=Erythrobacter mangrovi TaxID=2739433 RepID=A0A7D4AU34_9SPHN|nr:peptidyl-prolyl cis-trans isomerase [Erythrobacter mangrovi]QKG71637.1 SurA N-terminal domain-containing protein [Erythrobacter mangrovi]
MLQFFRNMFKSKIGLAIVLGFIGLIGFAFALSDISGGSTFGGVAGGDRVAVVGDEKIGTADLLRAVNNGLDRMREEDPTLTMPRFIANKGLDQSLDAVIDRFALATFADKYGIRAGDNLVNSEIRLIPAFRGPDGNFSEDTYRQVLAQQRITDAQARDDLGTRLLAQQVFVPAGLGASIPNKMAYRYAQLFKERRKGSIALLPAVAYAPPPGASDDTLRAYYDSHRTEFVRPERRVIRYATFDSSDLGDRAVPTEAEISARYKQDAAKYSASETRDVTQLIVPTEAAAKSIRDRIAAGASFDAVAREAGLRAASITDASRQTLSTEASPAVANAYFSTAEGTISSPARSALGWHVARVDAIKSVAARSLDQARSEITETLREEKRVRGLAELAIEVEDQLADGATLAEVLNDLGLELQMTKPALANGQVYQAPGESLPEVLAPALKTAFQMDEEEPEIAPIAGGETYLIFEVGDITPAATAPFAEIKQAVEANWRQSQGLKAAQEAADRVLKRVRGGATLAAALAAEDVPLPSVDSIDLTREQLASQRERRIPPPLALMFSMAQGTAKKLEAAQKLGFFVVDLDAITMDELDRNDPLVTQARGQMAQLVGDEYGDLLRSAIRAEMGVERNPTAIDAVRKQLLGGN